MFGGRKINAEAECRALAEVLSELYASDDVLVMMGRLVQNLEALLRVMKAVPDCPEEDVFADALDLFSTAALKLKYPLFCEMAQKLCIAIDGNVEKRLRTVDSALETVCAMRVWILKQLQ